jgi:aminoglycoside/choline kinase family phosphotransferase
MSQHPIDDDFLRRWVAASNAFGTAGEIAIEALAGDVSPRRYYRVRGSGNRAVVAYYPPDLREVALRFRHTSDLLTAAGVRVPAVLRFDPEAGLMLLEDVGERTLFDWRERSWNTLRPRLEAAWSAARRVRAIAPAALQGLLPPLDAAALERELAMTWDVFLVPNQLVGDDPLGRRLRSCLEALCTALEADGLVPCHRDLMARNLVPLGAASEVALLDHQDLRLGPQAYDAASLFNDSLYPPEEMVETLIGVELHRSAAYHRAVVQRTWKIVGTFASFARRGQPRYLPLVRLSLRRGLDHLAALVEGESVAADLRQRWARGDSAL